MNLRWIGLSLVGTLAFVACGNDDSPPDGSIDGEPCETDGDCDDGTFCNGVESCDSSNPVADARGCVMDEAACPAECDEEADRCIADCEDLDDDGAGASSCGGADCDDGDPLRYPGNAEVCDADGRDEDCDERTFGVRDADGDGSPDALCCNGDNCGDDCDDTRAAVNPLNVETCDGLDNDCDGSTDEGVLLTFYEDSDGDDFGSNDPGADTVMGCMPPPLYAPSMTDCDDDDGGVNPGVPEDCNGGDEDCDGMIDEDCDCVDPSTRPCPGATGACAAGQQTCVGGTWSACSVVGSPEICDGVDNDCDGTPDEGVADACYADPDRDGFAAVGATVTMRCSCMTNETTVAPIGGDIDCREGPASGAADTYPGATELCDGLDNDCSSGGGAVSAEDRDGDGFTATGYAGCNGGSYPKTDCNDGLATVNPGVTAYQTSGYCNGQSLCDCGGVMRCISAPMGCGFTLCSPTSGLAPSFDWNCNGTTEPQPARTGGCGPGGCTMPCGNSGCGPTTTQSISNCGQNVQYSCCGGCPCGTSTPTRALGCR